MAARLDVRDVSVAFGGIHAVDGVDLAVAPGEIVGLLGPNGAGKSTLVNCLSGFVRPDHGVALWKGVDLFRLLPHERARWGIGRTFQAVGLFPDLTAAENVRVAVHSRMTTGLASIVLGRRRWRRQEQAARERAAAALEFMGLGRYAGFKAGALSYGTLRLLELTCMVALEPELLLLDEPTSGIAQAEAEAFVPLLDDIRRALDASIVIVEHDLPLLGEVCDRLVAMHLGQVIAAGAPSAVLSDPQVVECYVGAEL